MAEPRRVMVGRTLTEVVLTISADDLIDARLSVEDAKSIAAQLLREANEIETADHL